MPTDQNNIRHSLIAVLLLISAAIYALVGIARPPQGTTITNEAISSYLFRTGQRVERRSNTTETIVQNTSLAVILQLTLSAAALIGNGVDSCDVEAQVLDAAGSPIPDGQPVEFTTSHGTFSNGNDTSYTLTAGGVARIRVRSDFLRTSEPVRALVIASTLGASGLTLSRSVPLLFYSAALEGRIVSAGSHRIGGIVVVAYDPMRQEVGRDTLSDNGAFVIPISQTGVYTLGFRYRNVFGDDLIIYANKFVSVPTSGGVGSVSPLNTLVGNIVDVRTGEPIRQSDLPVILYRSSASQPTTEGRQLPAMQVTDERGVFAFDSIAAGIAELFVIDSQFAGKLIVQHQTAGTFVIDANIALSDAPTFEVTKSANKRIAEIGDVITYSVDVRNTSVNSPLVNVRLVDELPHAFVYAKGSARKQNDVLTDPGNLRKLDWMIADSLLPGGSIKISYTVSVGAGALESDGINKAYAIATNIAGMSVRTAQASLQVTVRPGVFTDRGIVIGKVFYDGNENAEQDEGESGIGGVELWMEDGTRIVTGDDGKYSLPEVRPGQHVVRVNELTLPNGAELLALRGESAGSGLTRFVRLVEGGIARTDFYVRQPNQANAEVTFEKTLAQSLNDSIHARYVLFFNDIGVPTSITLADTLPLGYSFDYKSITWKQQKLYPAGTRSRSIFVDFQKRPANSSDTLLVKIVPDTGASGTLLTTRGRLTLGYNRGIPAAFNVVQRIGKVNSELLDEQRVPTIVDSSRMISASIEPDTLAVNVNSDTSMIQAPVRSKSVVKPQRRRSSTVAQIAPGDSSVKQATPSQPTDVNNAENDLAVTTAADGQSALVYWSVGVAVVALLFFLIWKRRRKEKEGEQA